jgi:flagellar hook assembly protein FlgD
MDLLGKTLLAYPNPGKGKMTLVFQPSGSGEAKVQIYNMSGERVAVLNTQVSGATVASVTWECSSVAPGLYMVRVVQDGREIGESKVAIVR